MSEQAPTESVANEQSSVVPPSDVRPLEPAKIEVMSAVRELVDEFESARTSIAEFNAWLEEHGQSAVAMRLKGFAASLDEVRNRVDGHVESVLARLERSRIALLDEAEEVSLSAAERRELVRKYRPGTIDQLQQRIEGLEQERGRLSADLEEVRRERHEARVELATNQVLLRQHEVRATAIADREERIASKELGLQGTEGLIAERNSLRRELEVLRGVERANALVLEDQRELAELRARRQEWDRFLSGRSVQDVRRSEQSLWRELQDARHQLQDLPAIRRSLEAAIDGYRQAAKVFADATGGQAQEVERLIVEAAEALRRPLESLDVLVQQQVDSRIRFLSKQADEAIAEAKRLRAENAELVRERAELAGRLQGIPDVERHLAWLQDQCEQEQLRHRDAIAVLERRCEALREEAQQAEQRRTDALAAAIEEEGRCAAAMAKLQVLQDAYKEIAETQASLSPKTMSAEQRRERIDAIDWRLGQSFVHSGQPLSESETDWLNRVCKEIKEVGFTFDRTLVEAFHTALKCSDIASLTVLAGVSGTGKSELPRLYGLAGGFRFLPVAVKPDWDAPQSLWGHYDYLEGSFLPTEFLQAWAQSQRSGGGGFADGMLLLLLDEMNLARTELYLADLLSLLENRRGSTGASVAIGLGAGCPAYQLGLGANVLLAGTMNEDETTHNLSDKILDRGNVIRFPRPKELVARANFALPQQRRWLSKAQWDSWKRPSSHLSVEIREPIGKAVSGLNRALGQTGRAIGHRVFQAIEAYVVNHPRLPKDQRSKSGQETAFSIFADQFEQRIIPKLRGIDGTSRGGRQCLDQVRDILQVLGLKRQLECLQASIDTSRDGPFEWVDSVEA